MIASYILEKTTLISFLQIYLFKLKPFPVFCFSKTFNVSFKMIRFCKKKHAIHLNTAERFMQNKKHVQY